MQSTSLDTVDPREAMESKGLMAWKFCGCESVTVFGFYWRSCEAHPALTEPGSGLTGGV